MNDIMSILASLFQGGGQPQPEESPTDRNVDSAQSSPGTLYNKGSGYSGGYLGQGFGEDVTRNYQAQQLRQLQKLSSSADGGFTNLARALEIPTEDDRQKSIQTKIMLEQLAAQRQQRQNPPRRSVMMVQGPGGVNMTQEDAMKAHQAIEDRQRAQMMEDMQLRMMRQQLADGAANRELEREKWEAEKQKQQFLQMLDKKRFGIKPQGSMSIPQG